MLMADSESSECSSLSGEMLQLSGIFYHTNRHLPPCIFKCVPNNAMQKLQLRAAVGWNRRAIDFCLGDSPRFSIQYCTSAWFVLSWVLVEELQTGPLFLHCTDGEDGLVELQRTVWEL